MITPDITKRVPSCVKQNLIDNKQRELIEKEFVRLYNVFLNNSYDVAFTLSDLLGGYNRNWTDTPMQAVYYEYLNKYGDANTAYKKAARDAGWFLMFAVYNDCRTFTSEYIVSKGKKVRAYRLLTI